MKREKELRSRRTIFITFLVWFLWLENMFWEKSINGLKDMFQKPLMSPSNIVWALRAGKLLSLNILQFLMRFLCCNSLWSFQNYIQWVQISLSMQSYRLNFFLSFSHFRNYFCIMKLYCVYLGFFSTWTTKLETVGTNYQL